MKYINILFLLALICSCNSGNKQSSTTDDEIEQAQEEYASKEKMPTKASAVQRVEAIYNVIFDQYKNAEHINWPFSSFFDDELQTLWNYIPKEGPGIGFDPWICAQDFDEDALKLLDVKVGDILENGARGYFIEAVVTLKLSENWEPHKVCLTLSTIKQGNENKEWYVHDFFDVSHPEYGGVIQQIKSEFLHNEDDEEMIDAMLKAVQEVKRQRGIE